MKIIHSKIQFLKEESPEYIPHLLLHLMASHWQNKVVINIDYPV